MPERICCITFTKAAASEMRHRVLSLLRQLLLAEEADCARQVSELLGRPATPTDIAHARSLFGTVLDSPNGGLQLTTIHGFCQNILRRFPLEAQIAPHFTVLEDAAAEKLFTACKHTLLKYYNSRDPLLNAALELVGTRSSEFSFDHYLGDIISKRAKWEEVWRNQTPDVLKTRLYALNGLAPDATEAKLTQDYLHCINDADAKTIRAHLPDLLTHANKLERETIAPVLTAWLELADASARLPLVSDFKLLFLTQKNEPRAKLLSNKPYGEGTPLYDVMQRLSAITQRYHASVAAITSAEESYAIALLARAMLELYAQAKAEHYALDYEDLIGKTRELFANPMQLGWVMSKLDHRIDHLLIDEAQDTSGEQWAIAQLLVEELIAASDGVGSGNVPRSLLVVGDEKQSIYSFQGAAPELFDAKKATFDALLAPSLAPLVYTELTTSYRSTEAVLKLVNHVAEQPQISAALSIGTIHASQLHRVGGAGRVALYAPLIAPEREPLPALTMPLAYAQTQSAAQLLADTVADQIQGWLESGRMLEGEGRKVEAGDILILVKNRTSFVLPLIRALQKRKVAVAGIDRLTLSNHLAVRDVLALMRWVMNPADDLSLAHVLRSPILGLSDEELRSLCVGRVGALWARIPDGPQRAFLNRAIEQRDASPYDFLTDLLEVQDIRRQFAKRFGEEVHEVLDELKAQSAAMPAEMPPTLAYFYDWLAGSERQIKREMEGGASSQVRIMTVHGAKGLEAPIVLLVDTVSVPTTQQERIFFAEDEYGQKFPSLAISDDAKQADILTKAKTAKADALLAEYYRLLYVALTRARDELHIWGVANKNGEVKAGSWYEVIAKSMSGLGAVETDGVTVLQDARAPLPAKAAVAPTPATPLPAWANATAQRSTAVATLSPSQLVEYQTVSPYVQSGDKSLRARGVRIHRVLELLEAGSDDGTIERLIQLLSPDWNEEDQASAAFEISQLLAQERWIWESSSHAEANICGVIDIDGRPTPINGQIDRLVETPDAFIILDYKTGRHVPKDASEIGENYRVQLKTYQALVQQISGGKPVRCAILWTAVPRLMWCDAAVAATAWPKQFVIEETPLVA